MDRADARQRFASARVARLGTADRDGIPHLVPVTFAVDADVIVFAIDHKPKSTMNLRRLRNIVENDQVCLLTDHYDDDWSQLWWARADGRAAITNDPDIRARALTQLSARYGQYRDRPPEGPVVSVTVESWSGWSYNPQH
ncbi:TIGR03668 family PPOX class F420-dependent oxidoreductase [Planomonospora venezuelensis]|uniref:PPOX class probable F420-dependent enzyme n=1 Tax=Planomonospora venezuelensis TaxID=1999 RepID=A0A841D000_PLAVE|nr:TIGR03668 family PPOX class F420-dependent oxidoreductase [Planomonospora venezuelensis]MBB5960886.1 PPOX class probable F420-dependent enzyme [Planomonospora venezuelensis]GIN01120.1 PPOX class F420-dependent oxidoreductase [Planomonospora venezuelensis]